MAGHMALDIIGHFLRRQLRAGFFDDAGHDGFAIAGIRHADDLDILNGGMGVDKLFDFLGVDVFSAADDHILEAAGDEEGSVRIAAGQIAGMEPAVGIDGGGGGIGHFIVALHDVITAGAELAVLTVRQFLAGFGIDDLALDMGEGIADGLGAELERIGPGGHGAAGGRLGLAIDTYDAAHIHFIRPGGALHEFGRAAGTGHDACAHIGEIRLAVVLVVKHGDKHGGDAVETGDPLLVDTGEGVFRREIGQGADGGSMGHGGRHGQDHAEAMEHGDLDHHTVGGGKAHAVADTLAVVDDVVMGEHDALGETGGSGGVLHIADIVGLDVCDHGAEGFQRDGIRPAHGLVKGEAAGLGEIDSDHIPEEGEALAMQGFAGLAGRDFRAELVDDLAVIAVQGLFDHDEGMGIALAEQIIRLVDFIGRIHGDEDGADAGAGPEGNIPGRDIRGPDGDLGTGGYAEGDQGPGKAVHIVAELGVGSGVIQGRVLEGILVREFLRHAVQDLAEGFIDELVLLPDIAAGAVMVEIKGFLLALGVVETVHIVDEMGEDDFTVGEIFHPLRFPFQGDETAVIDGGEGVHHAGDREGAFTDEVIGPIVVGIAEMDMLHIAAEVADGGIRGFIEIPVGMVNIPEGGQLVAGVIVHEGAEAGGIRKNAGGFDEQGDLCLRGIRQHFGEEEADLILIVLQGADGDIWHMHGAGGFEEQADFGRIGLRIGNIKRRIEAGDLQPVLLEEALGFVAVILMKGAAAIREGADFIQIVDLDAAELHFAGILDLADPVVIAPAAG